MKSSVVAEALGTMSERNSFLGLCKDRIAAYGFTFEKCIQHTIKSLV